MQHTVQTPFAQGDVIAGRYVLCDPIGVGGMGLVFSALQPALGRTVAIKLPRPEVCHSALAMRRFEHEAIACSRLSHPNIVSVFDYGRATDKTPYLAMHRLRGDGLGHLIARSGPFSLLRAARLVGQVIAALVEAHRLGMVHSDVKSDNILVADDGDGGDHATLIDFGLVRLPDRPWSDEDISGTPDYIAPEIVLGHAPTEQTDIYSVGCVLYELVTGTTPFGGGNSFAIMTRHLEDPVVPPSVRCPDLHIPSAFEAVIMRALAKRPEDRFASAAHLARALVDATPQIEIVEDVMRAPSVGYSSLGTTIDLPTAEARPTARVASAFDTTLDDARADVGAAIAKGDVEQIVVAYLALAHALIDRKRMGAAVEELTEAIDVVTCGQGMECEAAATLWPLLLSLAATRVGLGDSGGARRHALEALAQARRARSQVGRSRAKHMLAYLERFRPI